VKNHAAEEPRVGTVLDPTASWDFRA